MPTPFNGTLMQKRPRTF